VTSLGRAWAALLAALLTAAGVTFAVVTVVVAWDVIARNVGLEPPASTIAFTEYALLYACLAAGPALVRSRGHVTVDLLAGRLPVAFRPVLARLALGASAATALLIAVLAALLASEAVARGEVDVRSLDIPRAWLFAPMALGFLLMAGEFVRLAVRGEGSAAPVTERASL
jgi:TRAP-type C4-dicarboxylate transport system permease small subunit